MSGSITSNITFVERGPRANLHLVDRYGSQNQRLTSDSRNVSRNYTFSSLNGVLTEVRAIKEGTEASFLPAQWDSFSPKIKSLITAYHGLGEGIKNEKFRPGIPSMKIDLAESKVLFQSYEGANEEFNQSALAALSPQITELREFLATSPTSNPLKNKNKVRETYSESAAKIEDKTKCLSTESLKNALEVFVKDKPDVHFPGKVYDVKKANPYEVAVSQESGQLLVPLFVEGAREGETGHFVGLLIDFEEKKTYYYDSAGTSLSKRKEVKEFTQALHARFFGKRSLKFWKSHGTIVDTVKKQQTDKTSCGRYLLAYYRGRIEKGADHEAFVNASINTAQVINELKPIINKLKGALPSQRPSNSTTAAPNNDQEELKNRLTSKTEKLFNTDILDVLQSKVEKEGKDNVHIYPSTEFFLDDWARDKSGNKFESGKILFPLLTEDKHFVAVYVDIDQKEISYYDSKGVEREKRPEVKNLFDYLELTFKNFAIKDSVTLHQQDGVSCGRYVIDYFMKRLEGVSHEEFLNQEGLNDEEISRRMKALV